MSKDLLIELGCEELPPKSLKLFSQSFEQSFNDSFIKAGLSFDALNVFATPRRLAITVIGLADKQADQTIEKLGPAVSAAFDEQGKPTKAALGFARSNSVSIDELLQKETEKGLRLMYTAVSQGLKTSELISGFLDLAIKNLPVPKRMTWGEHRHSFSRPVHWVTCIFDNEVIDLTILGLKSGNVSYGHRFHAPEPFHPSPNSYSSSLFDRYVVANYDDRQQLILKQLEEKAASLNAYMSIDKDLLDEVTALVEWPVALVGEFDKQFLEVPSEVLISSMKEHQKYFHLLDADHNLLPFFITIANIESKQPDMIINGNERVIRPRLADAAFFFDSDKKKTLETRCTQLKAVTFQDKLGSIFDKSERLSLLSAYIAKIIDADPVLVSRAAILCKADLVSDMVLEFPDLQGVMGRYYAENDGEHNLVCDAILEHYYPKSADAKLPSSNISQALALADRIDTLVGIFAIGQQPTGNKDPFALRRSSLSILKIIIEKSLNIDLLDVFTKSAELYASKLPNIDTDKALTYCIERLKAYYQSQNIRTEIYLSVADKGITNPLDFDRRIKAVLAFDQLDASHSLSAANKRVNNLLIKNSESVDNSVDINLDLLESITEKRLIESIELIDSDYITALSNHNYAVVLSLLATLKDPVDNFFNEVMIMVDNPELKQNRLSILKKLSDLFSSVANIALLAKS